MKEYKLVQWYPSLPTEWNVGYYPKNKSEYPIIVVEREDGYHLHPSLKNLTRSLSKGLLKEEVEKNNEFWKKVAPKEFEILKRQSYPCQGVSNGGNYEVIESVRRLSDEVVFSLGDSVTSDFKEDGVQVIQSLDIKDERISVKLGKKNNSNFVTYRRLSAIHHYDEKVLTTEDDVDLITGDRYFVPQVEGKHRRLSGNSIMFYVEPNMPKDDIKRFAKEENAQVYIENNIELFSAKDIHELLKGYSRMMVDSSVYLELSRMVKERLDGDK